MKREATAAEGLSDRARSLINLLYNSGQSEDAVVAEFLNDVACSDSDQASDEHLIVVMQELRDTCKWVIKELKLTRTEPKKS